MMPLGSISKIRERSADPVHDVSVEGMTYEEV